MSPRTIAPLQQSRSRRAPLSGLPALLALALGLALLVPGVGAEAPPMGPLSQPGVALTGLEGVHTDVVDVFPPVRRGGLVVLMRSPSHRLVVHRSWLHVRPAPGEVAGPGPLEVFARVVVDLEGEGEVVADVMGAGLAREIRDEVVVPRQILRVAGRAEIVRRDEGFEILLLEVPQRVAIRIESALASRMVDLCEGFAAIPFVVLDCEGLDDLLSHAEVDLPASGSAVHVSDRLLGRSAVRFLASAGQRSPGPVAVR